LKIPNSWWVFFSFFFPVGGRLSHVISKRLLHLTPLCHLGFSYLTTLTAQFTIVMREIMSYIHPAQLQQNTNTFPCRFWKYNYKLASTDTTESSTTITTTTSTWCKRACNCSFNTTVDTKRSRFLTVD